jgi:hypothetical protein
MAPSWQVGPQDEIDISCQGGGGKLGASPGRPPAGGAPGEGGPFPSPPPAAAPAVVVHSPAPASGSSSAPVGLMSTVIEGVDGNESSTDNFW